MAMILALECDVTFGNWRVLEGEQITTLEPLFGINGQCYPTPKTTLQTRWRSIGVKEARRIQARIDAGDFGS